MNSMIALSGKPVTGAAAALGLLEAPGIGRKRVGTKAVANPEVLSSPRPGNSRATAATAQGPLEGTTGPSRTTFHQLETTTRAQAIEETTTIGGIRTNQSRTTDETIIRMPGAEEMAIRGTTTGTVVETRGTTEATVRITGTTTTAGQGPARDGRTTGRVSVPPLLSQSLTTVREAVVLRRSCQSAWTFAPQNHSTSSRPASRGVPRGAEKKLCLHSVILHSIQKPPILPQY